MIKQLCIEVIQFQSVIIFIYSAITANQDSLTFKEENSEEWKEFDKIVEIIPVDDIKTQEDQLQKTFESIIKAAASKFADIKIQRNKKLKRLTNFLKVQTGLSQEADQNLQFNLTMFQKENDLLRQMRMAQRSPIMTKVMKKMLQYIYTDQIIYIPIIDELRLTPKWVLKYEDPNYVIP